MLCFHLPRYPSRLLSIPIVDVTVLGLVGGAPGGETPRVADSSAAGAGRFFHNSCILLLSIGSGRLFASVLQPLAASRLCQRRPWLRGEEQVRLRQHPCALAASISAARTTSVSLKSLSSSGHNRERRTARQQGSCAKTWGCFVLASAAANGLPTGCPREVPPLGCRPT